MTSTNHDQSERILVVDDNRLIHGVFRAALTAVKACAAVVPETKGIGFDDTSSKDAAESFEVDSAYQGKEALDLVQDAKRSGHPYAMAFVDMRMPPGWDGIETISRMWKVDPELQIVICAGDWDNACDKRLNQLGRPNQLQIITKPFDIAEIHQLARTLTEKRELSGGASLVPHSHLACTTAHRP